MHQNPLLLLPVRALTVLWLVHDFVAGQSPITPRWGQAASLVQNTLYIHGGRIDQYNSYAYTSAPVTNDLLTLDLSISFNTSSPPWDYVSGCANCDAPQGPAVAWHTLSAFNVSSLLLFGGDPGPNSPIVLPEKADSAVLLDSFGNPSIVWDYVPTSWANEPLRRIYHTASFSQGYVWIVGGLKAEGSGNAFAEHYVFDPTVPSFTQLPSADGPPDILGHMSIVLPNGQLLIFGGFSPSQGTLMPMTTVWTLDTTQHLATWSTLPVATSVVPAPRRGFAATLVGTDKVIIHGGADAVLQNSFSDGWILDTSQNPMVWTPVDALSQLGPRRDHTAVAMGSFVLFVFGYGANGPASSTLSVFDISSSTFQPVFTPPATGSSPPVATLPGSSPTSGPGNSGNPGNGQSGSGSTNPNIPDPGNNNGSGGHGGGQDGSGHGQGTSSNGSHTTAIALGAVFGILGLLLGTTAAAYYMRRRHRSHDSFHLLSPNSDDDESPHLHPVIPVVNTANREKGLPLPPVMRNVKDRLTDMVPGRTARNPPGRRDMLADEDTRHFGDDWWGVGGIRRDPSSGRSSLRRPTLGDKVHDSLASLRSVGGAMLDYAAGATVARSMRKEGSGGSRSHWGARSEKNSSDPFGDDWGLVRHKRPKSVREGSSYTYVDPFEDYEVQSIKFDYDAPPYDQPDEERAYPRLSDPPPRPYLHAAILPAIDPTRLTSVSERPSLASLTESGTTPSESSHSNPSGGPFIASSSSHEIPRSPTRPSSLIDANSSTQPASSTFRRSNSWWIRFAKTPLLDRRGSEASRNSHPLDFRDPHPPPSRLVPIEESSSGSPGNFKRDSGSMSSGGHHQVWSSHAHRRSASSLQTSRTANSEALERMGQMDIVQKGPHGTDQSSSDGDPGSSTVRHLDRPLSVITTGSESTGLVSEDDSIMFVKSPDTMVDSRPQERQHSPPRRSPTGNVVSERVQAFERRMSQQEDQSLRSPPPVRPRNRGSTYGIAPRASLFVTNPDRDRSGSGGL